MTPGQARAFLAVALKGSFSEAARSIGVSQPTVTTQIKDIEREHEVELFCRSARGATLTPTGQALVPFIQRMFSNFDEAGAYLDTLKGVHRGQLRIGSYGPYDVMKLVARYSARFPAVSVFVDFANSQILAEKLISYELDVAVMGRIKTVAKFHALPFRNPPLVAIAPRLSPWIGRMSIKVSDFNGQTIVCREPGSAARAAHDQLLQRAEFLPDALFNSPAARASSMRSPKGSASAPFSMKVFCPATASSSSKSPAPTFTQRWRLFVLPTGEKAN
jgi:DNA-binding transcriptional LysR family regulator